METHLFDYITFKIHEHSVIEQSKTKARYLKSISIKKFELNAPEECVCLINAHYLGEEITILEQKYFEAGEITSLYEINQNELSSFPEVTTRFKEGKNKKKCVVKVDSNENYKASTLMFTLNEQNCIEKLSATLPSTNSLNEKYSCFYEAYDEDGNWTKMRETINETTFVTHRTIKHYDESLINDSPNELIQKYLDRVSTPKEYKPLGLNGTIQKYFWVEGNMAQIEFPYKLDLPSICYDWFSNKHISTLQIEGLIANEEHAKVRFIKNNMELNSMSNAWLILDRQNTAVNPEDFTISSVLLPKKEEYFEWLSHSWMHYLTTPKAFKNWLHELENYQQTCRFWHNMELLQANQFLYEKDGKFCIVTRDKRDIEKFLVACPYELHYTQGAHNF